MPIYTWIDKKSGLTVEVLRSFDDYDQPPQKEELPAEEQVKKKRKWEKMIGSGVSVVRSAHWGGKGYW